MPPRLMNDLCCNANSLEFGSCLMLSIKLFIEFTNHPSKASSSRPGSKLVSTWAVYHDFTDSIMLPRLAPLSNQSLTSNVRDPIVTSSSQQCKYFKRYGDRISLIAMLMYPW